MDNIEESANVQNEKVRMESTGRNSFSSSPSKKRKHGSESLELENENLKKLNQLPYTAREIEFQLCNKRLGTQLPIIRAECKRLRVESKELKAQLLSKKNAEIDFRKKISEMEEQLEHQRNLFGAETNERETMGKEKDKKIMELDAHLQEKRNIETSLQTKINEMEQKSDHQTKLYETEIGKHKATVEEQFKKIKDLDAQLLSKKNVETDLLQKFDEMKQQLNEQRRAFEANTGDLDLIIEEQKKKMEELKIELESKEKESKDFEADQELMQMNYKDELKKMSHLIETQIAEKAKLQEEHEKEKEELQAEISERNKIISNFEEDSANAEKGHEKEKEELQDEMIQLKNSDAEKQKLIDQEKKIAESENEAKSLEIEQLKQTLSHLQKSLDKSAAEKTQTMNEIAELIKKLNVLQEENNQLKNEIATLRPVIVNSNDFREMESESQVSENPIPLVFSLSELQATDLQSNDPHDFFTVEKYINIDESERKDKFSNSILLTMDLKYNGEKWLDKYHVEIPLGDSDCKIYIRRYLIIKSLPAAQFPTLIDRLNSNSSFWSLYLGYLAISFDDYKKLLTKSNIYSLTIDRITVTDEDGTLISVDQLLKEVPHIDAFDYTFIDGEKMDGIAQKLFELPKVETFRLWNIQEGFDLGTIIQFIKSNAIKKPYATSYWRFEYNVTEKIFAEIKRIHKEIVSTLPSSCRPVISNRTR